MSGRMPLTSGPVRDRPVAKPPDEGWWARRVLAAAEPPPLAPRDDVEEDLAIVGWAGGTPPALRELVRRVGARVRARGLAATPGRLAVPPPRWLAPMTAAFARDAS
jgi:hypothetical protein